MWKVLTAVLLLTLSTPVLATGEMEVDPCKLFSGEDGLQRDILTLYLQHQYEATYRDLNAEERANFLKAIWQQDSNITHIRVFESRTADKYAVVFSYLFENYLNDKPLVQIYCVERINGSLAMFLSPETLEGLISKDGPEQ
tara:strand:- start:53 stop:475 length:423 start_codon:yes stop_codon:yes gene_type:complete